MSNLNNVSDDKFIFACLEHEKTCDALSRAVYTDRMPVGEEGLEENIKSLVQHYASKVDHLKTKADITIEELPELVPPVVGFSNDLIEVFEAADETLQPYVKSEGDEDPHWVLISSEIEANLDQISRHFLNYLHWYFGQQNVSNESAHNKQQNYSQQSGNSQQGSNSQNFDRNSARGGQGGHRNSNSRDGGGRSRGSRNNDRRPPRKQLSPEEFEARRQKQEERAKNEVLTAIENLKQSEEREHSLRAANSYHRRLQHQLISDSDSGLYSYSVGEGRDRFVVITKNENMSSSE